MFACIHVHESAGSLVNFAYGFSPLVEELDPDTVVLDIAGCELLFGEPHAIGRRIARDVSAAGFKAGIALARNTDAAIHAARYLPGLTVIPSGEESKYLSKIPLKALCTQLAGIDSDRAIPILETIELWGIQNFGDFAALPESGVSERLGPDGLRLQRLARGICNRPLVVREIEPGFERSIQLDHPIVLTEPLSFVVGGLLGQLCASLEANAMATNELRLLLKLEDRSETDRRLNLPFPTRDQKILLKLLMLDIEAAPPRSAVVAVSIQAEPAKPRSTQNGLFQPLSPEPEKLELTIARIAKLVGAHNIGSPEVLDTHRPGAFRIRKFSVSRNSGSKSRSRSRVKSGPPAAQQPAIKTEHKLGFRVFRPPLRAEVHALSGRPTRISAKTDNKTGRSVTGKIVRRAGPWRTTGDWWAEDSWARDEWDVSVGASEGLYRIYRDLGTGFWFIEGMYD